jgi:uncharacterized protein YeaO (DUF488 family)
MLQLKRAYDAAAKGDGERILVERLWPRGLTKERAAIDRWMKELAPSPQLRKWFAHDPAKWKEFQQRYFRELREHAQAVDDLRKKAKRGRITLVYGARDEEHNAALALKIFLDRKRHRLRRRSAT